MKGVKMLFIPLMGLVVILIVLILSYGTLGYSPTEYIRSLGEFLLRQSFNVFEKEWWAGSPEVITATLWDYRGLDTVYETTVFYLAVIGCVSVFRLLQPKLAEIIKGKEEYALTVIVRVATKIVLAVIILISINIALHGHITPGGGFQAGSAFAIAPLLAIAAFSRYFVEKMGLKINLSHVLRSLGLIIIALVALLPLIYFGYLLQNQAKPWSPFPGYPIEVSFLELSGSLFYFDIGEYLNVAMGFLAIFILLSLPERIFKKDMEVVKSES